MSDRITLRGVSEELAQRLKSIARERGESLNSTVLQLLERAVGMDAKRERLARYATWTEEDYQEFQEAMRAQRTIDEELWE